MCDGRRRYEQRHRCARRPVSKPLVPVAPVRCYQSWRGRGWRKVRGPRGRRRWSRRRTQPDCSASGRRLGRDGPSQPVRTRRAIAQREEYVRPVVAAIDGLSRVGAASAVDQRRLQPPQQLLGALAARVGRGVAKGVGHDRVLGAKQPRIGLTRAAPHKHQGEDELAPCGGAAMAAAGRPYSARGVGERSLQPSLGRLVQKPALAARVRLQHAAHDDRRDSSRQHKVVVVPHVHVHSAGVHCADGRMRVEPKGVRARSHHPVVPPPHRFSLLDEVHAHRPSCRLCHAAHLVLHRAPHEASSHPALWVARHPVKTRSGGVFVVVEHECPHEARERRASERGPQLRFRGVNACVLARAVGRFGRHVFQSQHGEYFYHSRMKPADEVVRHARVHVRPDQCPHPTGQAHRHAR